uniref:Uncharacterized protein n=1 Tax=Gracilinema caldarium TaxID=215591 RepID=A0A7C3IIB1_9SPIR
MGGKLYQDIKETVDQLPDVVFCTNFGILNEITSVLFESFKYDVDSPVIEITWYNETFRKSVLDIAGQIIHHGRRMILKIPEVTSTALGIKNPD